MAVKTLDANRTPEAFYHFASLLQQGTTSAEDYHVVTLVKVAYLFVKRSNLDEPGKLASTFYHALAPLLTKKDSTKMTALFSRLITAQPGGDLLYKTLIFLFQTNRPELFLAPLSNYIRNERISSELDRQKIAHGACKQLYDTLADLSDLFGQVVLNSPYEKDEEWKEKQSTSSFPSLIKKHLYFFLKPTKKLEQQEEKYFLVYGRGLDRAGQLFKDSLKEDLRLQNPYVFYLVHKNYLKTVREIFDLSLPVLEKMVALALLKIKLKSYVIQEGNAERLSTLVSLARKDPNRFPFDASLKQQLDKHEVLNPTTYLKTGRDFHQVLSLRLDLFKTLVNDNLTRAEKWLPELKVVRPRMSLKPKIQPKIYSQPIVQEREEISPPLLVEPIASTSQPEKTLIQQLQDFRRKLGDSSSTAPSVHEKAAFWHFQSILVRLTNTQNHSKTSNELFVFITGLIQDSTLAVEQLLTHSQRNKNKIFSHDLAALLYGEREEIPHKIRKNILMLNRGEFMTRHLPRCRPNGNAVEKLLADLYKKENPSHLFSRSLTLAKEVGLTFLHLSAHPKAEPLFSLFQNLIDRMEAEHQSASWETGSSNANTTSIETLKKILDDRLSSFPFEQTKQELANLKENFLPRLQAIQSQLFPLKSTFAPLALSDSRLLTQMAAESLLYLLLDLQEIKYDKKEVDHNLALLVKKLNIPLSSFTDEEKRFLGQGKRIRQEMRYPNDRDEDLKNARDLAGRSILEEASLDEQGFQLVGKDQKIINRVVELSNSEIELFVKICIKILEKAKIN